MNHKLVQMIVGPAIVLGSVTFVGWRVVTVRSQRTPHYAILDDRSGSHPNGCASMLGLAEIILQNEPIAVHSTLTILVTGDKATANEPLQIARYSLHHSHRAIEGRKAAARREQQLLSDLQKKCNAAPTAPVSPIYLGVKEALADLHAQGCSDGSGCKLYVDSDAKENVEMNLRKALNGASSLNSGLPTKISNRGIKVVFCGFAVTASESTDRLHLRDAKERTPGREARLARAWESLFTDTADFSFEPYCPNANVVTPGGTQ